MSFGDATLPPPAVLWAQRNNIIYLTICIEDCENPKLVINPTNVHFRGFGGIGEKKEHEVKIELYKEIIPEQSKQLQTGRTIEMILQKKEPGPFWPHLTQKKERYHWLKVNFNKWKEEDDSDVDMDNEDNFDEMMRSMGDLGTSERPNFDNDESDSDDDDKDGDDDALPPLE